MNKLKELRLKNGIKQLELSKLLNTTQANISGWENDKWQPDQNALLKLADIYKVSVDYLLGRTFDNNIEATNLVTAVTKIPVFGEIPAGIPIDAIEDIIDYEEIPQKWLNGAKEFFALKIKGDSMSPRYLEGDIVIFEKSSTCKSGQNCAVLINGFSATFKKIIIQEYGITLQPLNSAYEPLFYTNEQIKNTPIEIIGVAKETRRKEN